MTNIVTCAATTRGDDTNPADLWLMATPTTVRVAVQARNVRAIDDAFDGASGYVFLTNPSTMQPQFPRSTQFPAAQ